MTILLDFQKLIDGRTLEKGRNVSNFWEGKEPCWNLMGCSKYVYPVCPAYHQRHKPCWECASTECRRMLNAHWECKECKVFKVCAPSKK